MPPRPLTRVRPLSLISPRSALVGLMALDRIIPKEWFVLCKVHIWGPAETWEQHIISRMNINCVMEEKPDPDWETAIVQTVSRSWSRWLKVSVQAEHTCILQIITHHSHDAPNDVMPVKQIFPLWVCLCTSASIWIVLVCIIWQED